MNEYRVGHFSESVLIGFLLAGGLSLWLLKGSVNETHDVAKLQSFYENTIKTKELENAYLKKQTGGTKTPLVEQLKEAKVDANYEEEKQDIINEVKKLHTRIEKLQSNCLSTEKEECERRMQVALLSLMSS